ncbi:hypothetical protein BGZ83_000653 [Gryganskiella cystojenkinii]|nr:hypothetical protein BGZ83_000653 [Gryganskiella cystojenkinii]
MKSNLSSSNLALIVALFAVLCMTTSTVAAQQQCESCLEGVVRSIPACEKIEKVFNRGQFSDSTLADQQCLCKVYQDPTILFKCKDVCPKDIFDSTIELSKVMSSTFCNNTVMANGKNAAVGTFSSTTMIFSGLVAVAMSVALAIAA